MRESVVQYNGIAVLGDLLSVTEPIMDADSIRPLACKALLGLSRSENAPKNHGTASSVYLWTVAGNILSTFPKYEDYLIYF